MSMLFLSQRQNFRKLDSVRDRGDRRKKLSPEEIYTVVIVEISFSGPMSHRYDISKQQVSPVLWYAHFKMNHRVFRVHRKKRLRRTSFIAGRHWLRRMCYALSPNYELSDKSPKSWRKPEGCDHYCDLIIIFNGIIIII